MAYLKINQNLLNEYFYYENSIRNQRNLKELKREKY